MHVRSAAFFVGRAKTGFAEGPVPFSFSWATTPSSPLRRRARTRKANLRLKRIRALDKGRMISLISRTVQRDRRVSLLNPVTRVAFDGNPRPTTVSKLEVRHNLSALTLSQS